MKRPLKPSDVPPGSVIKHKTWLEDTWSYCNPVQLGIIVLAQPCDPEKELMFVSWEDLIRGWEILRPGQDWQPCWVDEFNPADYQPGQEVDIETARRLHAAGVELEFSTPALRDRWSKVINPGWLDDTWYRIAKPKVRRNRRPDELPERFLRHSEGNHIDVIYNETICGNWIEWSIKNGHKWSRSLDGPWHEFWKDE